MSKALTAANTTVAFIGIGLMGLPMANNLLAAGFTLRAWNRTRRKAEALNASDKLIICDSVEDAIREADVVVTMLETGPIVEGLLYAEQQFRASPEGCLFIDMASIPPETAIKHHDALTASGRQYLDAPVSGGTRGAAEASLSIMAGGEAEAFARATPVLDALGNPTYIGPSGTGQLTKLANQLVVGITIGAVSEALLLACAGGADPVAVRKALMGGFAASKILDQHGQRMIDRNFEPGGTCRVQLKDMNTVISAAEQHQMQLPLSAAVRDEYDAFVAAGGEHYDHSALLLHLENRNQPHSVKRPAEKT